MNRVTFNFRQFLILFEFSDFEFGSGFDIRVSGFSV